MGTIAWQSLVSGLAQGLLYALLASGFALMFSVGRTFNLAHGELVVLGGYIAYWLAQWLGLDPLLSLPVALLVGGGMGLILWRAAARLGEPFELNALVLTFGASLLLQSLMLNLWTANYRVVVVPYLSGSIELVGARLSLGRLVAAGAGLAGWGGLTWLLARTTFGRALRAASQDRAGAVLVGISLERMDAWAFGLGAAAAGAAGPLFALLHVFSPTDGLNVTVVALTVAVVGGVGRMAGLLAGALFVGLAEALTVGLVGAQWRGLVLFGLLLVLLRLRAARLPLRSERTTVRVRSGRVRRLWMQVMGRRGGLGRHGGLVRHSGLPLLLGMGLLVPLLPLGDYALQVGSQAVLFAALAVGWSLLRRAGAISFGHAAFFGTGAYASALLALRLGWSPWVGALAGGVVAAGLAVVVGLACVPLRGPYFALGTLACAEILRTLALNWAGLTSGTLGLVHVPAFPGGVLYPVVGGLSRGRSVEYWAAWIGLCLAVGVGWLATRGRLGLALAAVRQNAVAAEALGVAAPRVRLAALVVSGFIAGLAGAGYAHFVGYLDPNLAFNLLFSAAPMVMAMFGGSLTLAGPIVGGLSLYLADVLVFSRLALTGHVALYGVTIIAVILLRPEGVIGREE